MITKEKFLMDFGGHGNSYSSYLVLNTTVDDVIRVLNEIDENMCVGSGEVQDNHVYFEVCKESPELIYLITSKLNTIGYADIDWEATYTVCAKNGEDYDGFKAEWLPDMHYCRDDELCEDEDEENALWDAFVVITDNETGAVFNTGAGAVDKEIEEYYADMVETHSGV